MGLPAEVHDARQEGFWVTKTLEHLLESNALILINVKPLIPRNEVVSDLLLAFIEEFSLSDGVRQEKERHEREDAGWQAFNKKENSPWRYRPFDRTYPVRERSTVGICKGGGGDEDSVAEADLFTWVEEGEIKWHSRPECCFCHALNGTLLAGRNGCWKRGRLYQEETTSHQAAPARDRGLDCCNKSPEEHDTGAPDMRLEVFPADQEPL